jgi:DNA polymerase elongation subunit (family B)
VNQHKIQDILFLDIETVPAAASFDELPERMQHLWEKKSSFFRKEEETAEEAYGKAGIYAEFGKVICISAGNLASFPDGRKFRIKSFSGEDEKQLLSEFSSMINGFASKRTDAQLCAHNGKEFDFPYLARRILINGLPLPGLLNLAGKKPWEVKLLDTMELWKFGDFKNYTSLDLLTAVFDIPTPKEDLDGSMVAETYYGNNDLARIVEYCQRDVVALTRLFQRFRGEKIIEDGEIEIVT